MTDVLTPDLCVIGAGSGGLSAAAAAAQLGAPVVLIERDRMGGDCLHYGCVPSKALIAAAKRAQAVREAGQFGVLAGEPKIDFAGVTSHVNDVIRAIEPNDSAERYQGLGVQVIQGAASFQDSRTVVAGGCEIRARRFVIATGSSPAVPAIPGVERTPFLTNETLLEAKMPFPHLLVVGGGPAGVEFAQAFRRLGSDVTLIEALDPLPREEGELKAVVLKQLAAEGVRIIDHARVERLDTTGAGGVHVTFNRDERSYSIDGSHLLMTAGRKPNVDGLNLDAARIKYDTKGIRVNSKLKTSNRIVYAIGDVIGEDCFTHLASLHARLVIKNALFRLPVKVRRETMPWVTFTDPELAHVGLTEEEARKRYRNIRVLRWPYHENDRAQAERQTNGFLKAIVAANGRILGASMVGAQAGELIQMWSLAMQKGINIKNMAEYVAPYPTLAEINARAALSYFLPRAAAPGLRRVIGWLAKLG
jgi:pyruvate/2-oxoglutarate dehydrogenase complex dihydrolipoamide dehydrogenase (E3) component